MISLKEWLDFVEYRITEGSTYCWSCYGPNARTMDSWDGDTDGVSSSIIFDTKEHIVYEVTVYDYSKQRAYRLINPDFKDAHTAESKSRGVDSNQAWDDVTYVELETEEDFEEKCRAIMSYEEYDTRVSIPLELEDKDLLIFMKAAHERDMTFNQFIEEALRHALVEFEKDPEGMAARYKEYARE